MENTFELLQSILDSIDNPDQEVLALSMNDVHYEKMFSLVVRGNEFGRLTRVFIAGKKLKPYGVQLHTHRYPVRITMIKGNIMHHVAKIKPLHECNLIMPLYNYKSYLNGGSGLNYVGMKNVNINSYSLPVGSTFKMNSNEFHTMSCSKGSIWIVEELGFNREDSLVLGVPFTPDNLYTKPSMFQINDRAQTVHREIMKIINSFNNIK